MATAATRTFISPDDLLRLPDSQAYELVDGDLVERKVSVLSSWVGGQLYGHLRDYCHPIGLGWVWPADNGYQCFPNHPNKVRKPDVSFIRQESLNADLLAAGHCPIAPDLAVEVLSPNELAYEVDEKVDEYLDAGVRLVWVINPENRTVRIYRADGSFGFLRESGELDGENVIPGFRCPVRELFPAANQPQTTP